MDFFLNTLSLDGQFYDYRDFFKSLKMIMTLRRMVLRAGQQLFLDRLILNKTVTRTGESFHQIIATKSTRDQKRNVLSLFNRIGPFWTENRISSPDSFCFLYPDGQSVVLTDTILQEAFSREQSACLSFSPSDFCYALLKALIYFEAEDPIERQIKNFFKKEPLGTFLETIFSLNSWEDMLVYCERNFTFLTIERKLVNESLAGEPFSFQLARTIIKKLSVLNDYMNAPIGSSAEKRIFNLYFAPGQSLDNFSSFQSLNISLPSFIFSSCVALLP